MKPPLPVIDQNIAWLWLQPSICLCDCLSNNSYSRMKAAYVNVSTFFHWDSQIIPSNNPKKKKKGNRKKNDPICWVLPLFVTLLALNTTWFPLIPCTDPRNDWPFESLIVKVLPFIFNICEITLSDLLWEIFIIITTFHEMIRAFLILNPPTLLSYSKSIEWELGWCHKKQKWWKSPKLIKEGLRDCPFMSSRWMGVWARGIFETVD